MTTDTIVRISTFSELQAEWSRRGLQAIDSAEKTSPGPEGDRDFYRSAALVLVRREATDILSRVMAGVIPADKVGRALELLAERVDAGPMRQIMSCPAQVEGFEVGMGELRRMAEEARWTAAAVKTAAAAVR